MSVCKEVCLVFLVDTGTAALSQYQGCVINVPSAAVQERPRASLNSYRERRGRCGGVACETKDLFHMELFDLDFFSAASESD